MIDLISLVQQCNPSRDERWHSAESYEQRKAVGAWIILRDVDCCGGETAGLVIWAHLPLAHASDKRAA